MIIGLTGPLGSGKGVIAAHLQELGFKYYSLSNTVREEAKLRNIKFTRENLQKLGNLLREEFGVGVWAIKTMEKIDIPTNIVIDGIRNPGEIEELKKNEDFILIGINAPRKTRLQRIKGRNRPSDPKTFAELKAAEERDRGVGESSKGQQVQACLDKADFTIENTKDKEHIFNQLEELFSKKDIAF